MHNSDIFQLKIRIPYKNNLRPNYSILICLDLVLKFVLMVVETDFCVQLWSWPSLTKTSSPTSLLHYCFDDWHRDDWWLITSSVIYRRTEYLLSWITLLKCWCNFWTVDITICLFVYIFIYCSAWLRLKLITKITLHAPAAPQSPSPQTISLLTKFNGRIMSCKIDT